jgi:chromosomal replication initiation ATPase DnaA
MTKEEIFESYTKAVCDRFSIEENTQLFKKTKQREVVDARYTLYYMCRKRPMRISRIQRFMHNKGYDIAHSCIIYGINQMSDMIKSDKDYEVLIKELEEDVVYIT